MGAITNMMPDLRKSTMAGGGWGMEGLPSLFSKLIELRWAWSQTLQNSETLLYILYMHIAFKYPDLLICISYMVSCYCIQLY